MTDPNAESPEPVPAPDETDATAHEEFDGDPAGSEARSAAGSAAGSAATSTTAPARAGASEEAGTREGDATTRLVLPLVPVRQASVFPGMRVPLELGRRPSVVAMKVALENARRHPATPQVVIALQRDPLAEQLTLDTLQPIAVLSTVEQVLHGLPGRATAFVRGDTRVRLLGIEARRDHLVAVYEPACPVHADSLFARAKVGALHDLSRRYEEILPEGEAGDAARMTLRALRLELRPDAASDLAALALDVDLELKTKLLLELDVDLRLDELLRVMSRLVLTDSVRRDVQEAVQARLSQNEHEVMLRQQMRALVRQLRGDDEDEIVRELERRLSAKDLPPEARSGANRELGRLRGMNPVSAEAQVARTWLEWIADLPWGDADASRDTIDVNIAKTRLENEHFGLEKPKRRVLEYLCVRSLAPTQRGPILCLAGPPGVGKTSLARSIAESLGRKMVRIALGGVRAESEVRGHRRTYVGALPGRLIQALKTAQTSNPLILLDEIDKLGGGDMRGDPTAALLEALDPEQNSAYEDHYLGVPYDLSRVLFICTANEIGAIPPALLDRLEVLEISGYTIDEKVQIARLHLIPRLAREHGLLRDDIKLPEFDDATIEQITTQYTRESGVRQLERNLAAILRDVAMQIAESSPLPREVNSSLLDRVLGPPRYHDELAQAQPRVGVVMGLGWTPTGGRPLMVEATASHGAGRLRLTGRLGEVMRESGLAALSVLRSRPVHYDVDPKELAAIDIHVHLPEGGVAKDGPSAGLALLTALVSIASGRSVRPDVAMTGELTLRGQVLAIGGVREKVLAAHRAGIRDVILPKANRKDEDDIPPRARADLRLHWVDHVDQALQVALLDPPTAISVLDPAPTSIGEAAG